MGCNKCGTSSCSCKSCGTSGTPFYLQTDVCKEDHCEKVYVAQFSFAICPTASWNVPSCNQTAVLSVPGTYGAAVGSYLWASTFGYFEITSVDSINGVIGITNNCTDGNASPGTQIPECTCFVVTVPPIDIPSLSNVCVAIDFTAPVEDVPLDITLTSTNGLTAADTIQIGTGFYFIQAIKPNNIITIVNQGLGITPGTPVIATDANGEFQYCLSIISTNPCDRGYTPGGALMVCDGDGNMVPLGNPCEAGYIPVVVSAPCKVEMQPGIVPNICSRLEVILDVVNGDATYIIDVTNSSDWVVGDILIISGLGTARATITGIPSGTQAAITISPVPTASISLPIGTLVCTISCCEELANTSEELANAIECIGDSQLIVSTYGTVVTPGSFTTGLNKSAYGVTNAVGPYTNTCSVPLDYSFTVNYLWSGAYTPSQIAAAETELYFYPLAASTVGVIGSTVAPVIPALPVTISLAESQMWGTGSAFESFLFGRSHSVTYSGTLAPGDEIRFSARANLSASLLTCTLAYTHIDSDITATFVSS